MTTQFKPGDKVVITTENPTYCGGSECETSALEFAKEGRVLTVEDPTDEDGDVFLEEVDSQYVGYVSAEHLRHADEAPKLKVGDRIVATAQPGWFTDGRFTRAQLYFDVKPGHLGTIEDVYGISGDIEVNWDGFGIGITGPTRIRLATKDDENPEIKQGEEPKGVETDKTSGVLNPNFPRYAPTEIVALLNAFVIDTDEARIMLGLDPK